MHAYMAFPLSISLHKPYSLLYSMVKILLPFIQDSYSQIPVIMICLAHQETGVIFHQIPMYAT